MSRAIKHNHCGAKNGGGLYGTRKEAKEIGKRGRREEGKREIRQAERDRD